MRSLIPFVLAISAAAVATYAADAQATVSMAPDTAGPSMAARMQGDSAAASHTHFGWFGRGLVAGAVTGPLGTWWIVHRAGRGAAELTGAERAGVEARGTDFAAAYRAGYEQRVRSERQEYAFMGGALGTAAFTFVLLRATHLLEKGGGTPENPPPPTLVIGFRF